MKTAAMAPPPAHCAHCESGMVGGSGGEDVVLKDDDEDRGGHDVMREGGKCAGVRDCNGSDVPPGQMDASPPAHAAHAPGVPLVCAGQPTHAEDEDEGAKTRGRGHTRGAHSAGDLGEAVVACSPIAAHEKGVVMHADEEEEPGTGVDDPVGQSTHVAGDVAPMAADHVPMLQSVHEVDAEDAAHEPAGQGVQLAAPDAENDPRKHDTHETALFAPSELLAVPAAHDTHEVAPPVSP